MANTIGAVADTVEALLRRYDLDPADHAEDPGDGGRAWELVHGSALVSIHLFEDESGGVVVEVASPIVEVPRKEREAFFEELLTLNAEMLTASFALVDDQVMLHVGRVVTGLDVDELHEMVTDVAGFADHFDDDLADRFRTRRLGPGA